jgi:hypothetical protein
VNEQLWCFFLLRNIDRRILRKLRKDAEADGRSLSDFIRSILCEHYSLDCPPSEAPSKLEFGARTQLLRLQPGLFQAIKAEAADSPRSMRLIIMDILELRYVTKEEEIPA